MTTTTKLSTHAAHAATTAQAGSVTEAAVQNVTARDPQAGRTPGAARADVGMDPRRTSAGVAQNLVTDRGFCGTPHPSRSNSAMARVPADGAAARKLLASVGIETSGRLTNEGDIRKAHGLLSRIYKENHTETAEAEIGYAKDSSYEIQLVKDRGRAYGVASGWHLGKTGFQIDYLSPIEFPRKGADRSRDVAAGLALMRQMANRHHAKALWVEVDAEMRKHYEAAGFKDLAAPHPDDPAALTMMVLPLDAEFAKRIESDPKGLWMDHVRSWYAANWDDLSAPASQPARDAIAKMSAAAERGECQWIQALP